MTQTSIGIDAGGTLTKIVYSKNGDHHVKKSPTADIGSAIQLLQATLDGAAICLTGGKAHAFKEHVDFPVQEMSGAMGALLSL